ncbi:hypothetical protein BHM03_00017231, partial [Ensete ventricosum]
IAARGFFSPRAGRRNVSLRGREFEATWFCLKFISLHFYLTEMGIYLSTPKTEKFSEDGDNDRLRFGLSSMQGWRATMEDAVSSFFSSAIHALIILIDCRFQKRF